jgi:hypothetical protein
MNDASPPRRARSMAEMEALNARVFVDAEIDASIASYRPRPSDVVISPYSKCGTTWLQQIFHTLRTGGDMDFDDISRVVPWIESAVAVGIDLEAPQRGEPRGFKSHLNFDALPPGVRAIASLRDPRDACVSFYRFMEGWMFEPGAISIEDFADWYAGRPDDRSYWGHLLSWWQARHAPNVLLLSYEQMIAEPAAAIRRVAAFCGIPLSDALLDLTLERSSIGFMLAHKDQFSECLIRGVSEARANLPPGSDSAKVRKGGIGGHVAELPPAAIARLDAKWRAAITPVTGFADYAALEAALQAG